MRGILKRVGYHALRPRALRRAAAVATALRGRGLVLVFHRVLDESEPPGGLVPAVPERVFRQQVDQLLELGEVVPLRSILGRRAATTRPSFALTFDDDYRSHHDLVLPILRARGVTATFFVGGRSLHGLGPAWFEVLDRLRSQEVTDLGGRLGLGVLDLARIAEACERDPSLQHRIEQEGASGVEHLTSEHLIALAGAGMTVGFHTVHHRNLMGLPQDRVDEALTEGRSALEEVLGDRVALFAYPHGKADPAVAARVRSAGFLAAWTGRPVPITPRSDRYLLGRWEPPPVSGHGFVSRAIAVSNRGSWRAGEEGRTGTTDGSVGA